MDQPEQLNWREIQKQLADVSDGHGLRRLFPLPVQSLSLLDAVQSEELAATTEQCRKGALIAKDLNALLSQLIAFERISRCPVVAITGLLNAGKSSLLASYLTTENRHRVLRGTDNLSGTHRFVLWLPSRWKSDPELLGSLISFMTDLFGCSPEPLSDDRMQAAQQYNGSVLKEEANGSGLSKDLHPIQIPLIAYDDNLNQLSLALMDCPDIQTGVMSEAARSDDASSQTRLRQEMLHRVGKLCSAFLVVTRMNSMHDKALLEVMTTLRDTMPGVPRLLAVNRVKSRYAPNVVWQDTRGLADRFGIQSTYAAYDFRSAVPSPYAPPPPSGMIQSHDEPLPIFFRVDPNKNESKQYLYLLGQELEVGKLSVASGKSLQDQLRKQVLLMTHWLRTNETETQIALADAWNAVATACYDFMVERDVRGAAVGLRLQASPAIVSQMADSLQRTAPIMMRASMYIDRTARQLNEAVVSFASRFTILQSASESVRGFVKRIRSGEIAKLLTPQQLAKSMISRDAGGVFERFGETLLTERCDQAMKRFAAEDNSQIDAADLDQWTSQIWKNMSFKEKMWKGLQPLALTIGPLLAVLLVPIDGGGSAVLVFASGKELLAAAGVAAFAGAVGTGGEAVGIVQKETPWKQLSDLFALLCDSAGLPRPTESQLPRIQHQGQTKQLLPSKLPVVSMESKTAIQVWKLDERGLRSLERAVR